MLAGNGAALGNVALTLECNCCAILLSACVCLEW